MGHQQRQVELVKRLVPTAREQLLLLQQQANGSPAASLTASGALVTSVAAQDAVVSAYKESVGVHRRQFPHNCDGCGQQAVGLRRCARCKRAQYCKYACMCPNCIVVWLAPQPLSVELAGLQ